VLKIKEVLESLTRKRGGSLWYSAIELAGYMEINPSQVKSIIKKLRLLGKEFLQNDKVVIKYNVSEFYNLIIDYEKRKANERKEKKQIRRIERKEAKKNLPAIFNFDGKTIRTIKPNNKIMFVAKDACDTLDIKNVSDAVNSMLSRLTDAGINIDGIAAGYIVYDSLGRKQEMLCVNETGLYELIISSRKKEATRFRYWITNEVLPAIRKEGKYEISKEIKEFSAELRKGAVLGWIRQGLDNPKSIANITKHIYNVAFGNFDISKDEMTIDQLLFLALFEIMNSIICRKFDENLMQSPGIMQLNYYMAQDKDFEKLIKKYEDYIKEIYINKLDVSKCFENFGNTDAGV